jgi:hypothetical protein
MNVWKINVKCSSIKEILYAYDDDILWISFDDKHFYSYCNVDINDIKWLFESSNWIGTKAKPYKKSFAATFESIYSRYNIIPKNKCSLKLGKYNITETFDYRALPNTNA